MDSKSLELELTKTPLRTMKNTKLLLVRRFVKEAFSNSTRKFIIAGGAVRDYVKNNRRYSPKDFDVFINYPLGPHRINYLKAFGKVTEQDKKYPGYTVVTLTLQGDKWTQDKDNRLVGETIQFCFNHSTPDRFKHYKKDEPFNLEEFTEFTIRTFDWNINAFAYDGTDIYQYRVKDGLDDVLYCINPGIYPQYVLERGLNYRTMFNMYIERRSMARLCQAIADKINAEEKLPDLPDLSR